MFIFLLDKLLKIAEQVPPSCFSLIFLELKPWDTIPSVLFFRSLSRFSSVLLLSPFTPTSVPPSPSTSICLPDSSAYLLCVCLSPWVGYCPSSQIIILYGLIFFLLAHQLMLRYPSFFICVVSRLLLI